LLTSSRPLPRLPLSLPPSPAGKQAVEFFHQSCPALPGLKEGENEAEWIVDLTVQADRQGRSGDFAAAYESSEFKSAADSDIARLLAKAEDLGGLRVVRCGGGVGL
jgi:hypothetical protein